MAFGNITDFYIPISANAGSSLWGSDVRKVLSAAESSSDTSTRTQHGTGGNVDRLEDPYTDSTADATNIANYGWAIAPTDMGGATGARRFFPAGDHVLTARVCSEGLTGKSGCILYMKAYRVGVSPGYTRTLLGTASTTFSTSGLSIYGTVTVTLSLSEVIFEPGETIQYSFYLNAPGTFLTGENYRFETGHDSSADVKLHTPKLGVLADTAGSVSGAGAATGAMAKVLGCAGSCSGVGSVSGLLGADGSMQGATVGAGTASGVLAATGSTAGAANGAAVVSASFTGIGSMAGGSDGVSLVEAVFGAIGGMVGDTQSLAAVIGYLGGIGSMAGLSDGLADVIGFGSSVAQTAGQAAGSGEANGLISKVLGTVGTVNVGEGGGTTVIKKIFTMIDD